MAKFDDLLALFDTLTEQEKAQFLGQCIDSFSSQTDTTTDDNDIKNIRFDNGRVCPICGSTHQLHFDVVKFDKCLIDSIGERRGELILKYSMALAKELGLKIIAEGVEEEHQVKFLRENGCEYIQGYYFSRPLPKEEFEKFAKKYVDKQM